MTDHLPEGDSRLPGHPRGETSRADPPREGRPAGLFVRGRGGEAFPEPKPVPRWMVVAWECVLFGLPVLLVIMPFGPRLPRFGLEAPGLALVDLCAVLAVVFGAGALVRAFVLSGRGGALRRFGAKAKEWYAADRNRYVWTYLGLLGLWFLAFQLPRLSGVAALVFVGSLAFCLAGAFVIFTAGLAAVAGRDTAGSEDGASEG